MAWRRAFWLVLAALLAITRGHQGGGGTQHTPVVANPTPPVTPSQFTSIVVVGLNANSPYLNEEVLSSQEEAPLLPVGSGRHWAALHTLQRKAGNSLFSPQGASQLHSLLGPGDWSYLAGQYYYNAGSQKIRIDSTLPGGFLSSYSYYVYGAEWIYMFMNTANTTCQKYSLDKGSFPDVNWLQNAQYVGVKQILGVDTYHWHGKGNHLGPDVGLNVYDYYVSVNDSSPVLISNAGFVQYFMTFSTTNMSSLLWNYPNICDL